MLSLVRSRLSRGIISVRGGPSAGRLASLGSNADAGAKMRAMPGGLQQVRFHGGEEHVEPDAKTVHLTFVKKDGEEQQVEAKVGQNLLRLAQRNDIELEGACECSVACSTCHVILEEDLFDALPLASEDEDDMLDMAFGLTET
mmetsp:Transcript_24342/g.52773  ORF Transcript_24342/g.52773 Transcript_24342/m.52773 type:complete len:143 (-) Transcript_24342:262-690(-)